MKMPEDLMSSVFAYRAFDLRDRFPQPLEIFLEKCNPPACYIPYTLCHCWLLG